MQDPDSAAPAVHQAGVTQHREVVRGMPALPEQEVRVLSSTLLPGDVTPYHSHRFPVTVYMLEGTFTLELDGREPVVVKAGEVFVEPAGINMTGFNRGDVPSLTIKKDMIFDT